MSILSEKVTLSLLFLAPFLTESQLLQEKLCSPSKEGAGGNSTL